MLRCLAPALLLSLTPALAPGVAAAEHPPAETSASHNKGDAQIKKKKKKTTKKRRCRAYANPRYKKMVRNWQKVPRIPKTRYRAGYRDLTIYSVNLGERVRVFPYLPDGTLDPEAVAEIEQVFRDKDTDATHEIHPRLIKLLYRLVDHFDARQITLISGFRDPGESKTEGAHGKGRAVDFMIPGVKLPALAKVARRLGHVGVGYYPTSGFIHLDVREGTSYFWADRSGPGIPGCPRQIMKSHGPRFDRKWKPEHDAPELHRNKQGELLGAIEPAEDDPAALSEDGSSGSSSEPSPPVDAVGTVPAEVQSPDK
jgi:uncharacterized protein YcbK (DUF882 family)